jgi:hypothetical protein
VSGIISWRDNIRDKFDIKHKQESRPFGAVTSFSSNLPDHLRAILLFLVSAQLNPISEQILSVKLIKNGAFILKSTI